MADKKEEMKTEAAPVKDAAKEVSKEAPKEETKKDADKKDSKSDNRKGRGKPQRGRYQQEAPKAWVPKTELGRKVMNGEITDIDEILNNGLKVMEPEIVDKLLPDMEVDLLAIGQSKGKFGGGQRRVFRQTQKKTREGNKPKFSAYAVCGDKDGHIGVGFGKARETVPAREKSFRLCKLDVFKIRRACSSWECTCNDPHSIPYKVTGKCGSVEVTLMPAPKGTGLCAEKEMAKILRLAGIKDVWSKTKGKTKTKINHIKACIAALKQLTETKVKSTDIKKLCIVEGANK